MEQQDGDLISCESIQNVLCCHERGLKNLQAALFLRSPISFGIIVFLVEGTILLVKLSHLGIISTLLLLLMYNVIFRLFYHYIGDKITDLFFQYDQGQPCDSNRIRSIDEIMDVFCPIIEFINKLWRLVHHSDCEDGSHGLIGYIITIGIAFLFFMLFWGIGTFWPIAVIVNLLLFFLPVLFHPKIYPKVAPILNKVPLQKYKTQ